MKTLLFVLALVLGSLSLDQTAFAHVIIKDTSGVQGSILHISPDDDPIAGETTDAFYDIQSSSRLSVEDAKLKIIDESGSETDVTTFISKGNVSAQIVFPTQGLYKLVLNVTSGQKHLTFEYDQRVSRGIEASSYTKPTHKVAQAMLVFSGVGILVLLLVALNLRARIITQSRF